MNKIELKYIIDFLDLEIIYLPNENRVIENCEINILGVELLGFLKYFDNTKINILTKTQCTYLNELGNENRRKILTSIFEKSPPALVISKNIKMLNELDYKRYNVALLKAKNKMSELIFDLQNFLKVKLFPVIRRHGVLLEIYGQGVLIVGKSKAGKTETALELIRRGHFLISDDAVDIREISPNLVIGFAPRKIESLMSVRDIGIINIRKMFGTRSIKKSAKINLIVKIEDCDDMNEEGRISNKALEIKVPQISIRLEKNKYIPSIIETAVFEYIEKTEQF